MTSVAALRTFVLPGGYYVERKEEPPERDAVCVLPTRLRRRGVRGFPGDDGAVVPRPVVVWRVYGPESPVGSWGM